MYIHLVFCLFLARMQIRANYSNGTIRVYCLTLGSSDGGAGYAHLASISLPLKSNTLKLPEDHVSGLKPRRRVCVR